MCSRLLPGLYREGHPLGEPITMYIAAKCSSGCWRSCRAPGKKVAFSEISGVHLSDLLLTDGQDMVSKVWIEECGSEGGGRAFVNGTADSSAQESQQAAVGKSHARAWRRTRRPAPCAGALSIAASSLKCCQSQQQRMTMTRRAAQMPARRPAKRSVQGCCRAQSCRPCWGT